MEARDTIVDGDGEMRAHSLVARKRVWWEGGREGGAGVGWGWRWWVFGVGGWGGGLFPVGVRLVVLCLKLYDGLENTECFIHPTTGIYSVTSHIENNKNNNRP